MMAERKIESGMADRIYGGLMPPATARAQLLAAAAPVTGAETCRLAECAGRRIAEALIAETNLPATANAAVDGYAVHAAFLTANPAHTFRIIGRAAAGHPFSGTVAPGEAVRIFTGAIMPDGPDAVAMHEFCEADAAGQTVQINSPLKAGTNSRPAGENIRIGETIIAAGKRLGPADIGIAAAAGQIALPVRQRLVVGLVSMGDEIVEPGARPRHGQSFDSNRPMLRALLAADGHNIRDFSIVPDDAGALTDIFRAAFAACDVVISSGGASDGDEDHTQAAMQALGAELIFWRLAMKPGRPMAVATLGARRLFCLPGNPVAAFVCYRLLVAPVLEIMAGGVAQPPLALPARAGFDHKKSPGRAEYLRVRLEIAADGVVEMQLHGRRGAGVLSSLTGADGLVEIPVENDGVRQGDYLPFIPLREAGL